MIKLILKKLLKQVDISLIMKGDDVKVNVSYAGITLYSIKVDILKDGIEWDTEEDTDIGQEEKEGTAVVDV